METIHGFSVFEKPVISEYIWHENAPYAITDINFLTKIQKEENQLNRSSPR
jgi:hypothetical protein